VRCCDVCDPPGDLVVQDVEPTRTRRERRGGERPRAARASGPLADGLRGFRRERAAADGVPPYVVFSDATLDELCARRPDGREALLAVPGMGPVKVERYGEEILALVRAAEALDA
jgi:ATP-dependent DNA helicase RecQ